MRYHHKPSVLTAATSGVSLMLTAFILRMLVAITVTAVDLKDTGHWVMEKRPEETIDALIAFL